MSFVVKRVELNGDDVISSGELPNAFDYLEEAKKEAHRLASLLGDPIYNPEQGFYTVVLEDRSVRFITMPASTGS